MNILETQDALIKRQRRLPRELYVFIVHTPAYFMEKDIDRIAKGHDTDIVIRIDDFGGKRGLTIREYVTSERYTGFTKSGLRIPADKFILFKKIINGIDEKEFEAEPTPAPAQVTSEEKTE